MKKIIRLSVESNEGDNILDLVPSEAMEVIRDHTENHGKWLYVDGNYTNVSEITEEDLREESDYFLGYEVEGGNQVPESTPWTGTFSIRDDLEDNVSLTICLDSETHQINTALDGQVSGHFVRNRGMVTNILSEVLVNEGLRELREVQTAVRYGPPVTISDHSYDVAVIFDVTELESGNSIEMSYDVDENYLIIQVDRTQRFTIIHNREFIVHEIATKLESFAQDAYSNMRQAISL